MPCCQLATAEEVDAEPDRYVCDFCVLREQFEALWEPNREAWELWRSLNARPVVDFHLGPTVFASFCGDRTSDEVIDLIQRLSVIGTVLTPPEHQAHHGNPRTHYRRQR